MIQNLSFLKILMKSHTVRQDDVLGGLRGVMGRSLTGETSCPTSIYSSHNKTLKNGQSSGKYSIYSCQNMSSFARGTPFDQEKKNRQEEEGRLGALQSEAPAPPTSRDFVPGGRSPRTPLVTSPLPRDSGRSPAKLLEGTTWSKASAEPQGPPALMDLPCVFSYVQSSETRVMNRFLNFLTKKGKKSTAESIFSKTLYLLTKKTNEGTIIGQVHETLSIFAILDQAISNVKPFFEVKKVRVAGTTYQVPSLMKSKRQEGIAIKWILQSASERKKKNPSQRFENCLAFEIFEAFQKQGQARMKRNELHKLAEANRAFSHFRWW